MARRGVSGCCETGDRGARPQKTLQCRGCPLEAIALLSLLPCSTRPRPNPPSCAHTLHFPTCLLSSPVGTPDAALALGRVAPLIFTCGTGTGCSCWFVPFGRALWEGLWEGQGSCVGEGLSTHATLSEAGGRGPACVVAKHCKGALGHG